MEAPLRHTGHLCGTGGGGTGSGDLDAAGPSTHGTEERQLREEDLTRKEKLTLALRPLLAALRFRVCDVLRTRSEKAERPGCGQSGARRPGARAGEKSGLRRTVGG